MKNCFLILVIVVFHFNTSSCGRSSRPSSRPSPTYSRPRPSPTYRPYPRPSPTSRPYPRPSPTFRPFPKPSPTFRPFPTHAPTYRPFPTHAPTYKPFPTHAPTYKPFPTHSPTYKPFPTHSPTYKPFPTHSPTYRPFPTHQPTSRPYPSYPSNPGTRYPTRAPTRYPQGPYTNPAYVSGGTYVNSRPYQPSYAVPIRVPSSGGTKIKVYNIRNYHTPGYWAPPSYPSYHYTYRDTGNSALGFYLGYSLGRINHPTYYYHSHSFYDGYNPRYDHYTVHHYYHNSESIPKQQTITTKVIVQCGDGSEICPANTTGLCTANGQIMCVVIASNTLPCKSNSSLQCVKSTVPCENNETPECKGVPKGQKISIDIPCISNTVIEGNITKVNNSIVSLDRVTNTTLLPSALTATPSSLLMETTLPPNSTLLPNSTLSPNSTFPSLGATRRKREVPQFCVTVLATPSQRTLTEGEQVFNEVTNVFESFFVKAFGMNKPVKT